jgi:hypothetical protein
MTLGFEPATFWLYSIEGVGCVSVLWRTRGLLSQPLGDVQPLCALLGNDRRELVSCDEMSGWSQHSVCLRDTAAR